MAKISKKPSEKKVARAKEKQSKALAKYRKVIKSDPSAIAMIEKGAGKYEPAGPLKRTGKKAARKTRKVYKLTSK